MIFVNTNSISLFFLLFISLLLCSSYSVLATLHLLLFELLLLYLLSHFRSFALSRPNLSLNSDISLSSLLYKDSMIFAYTLCSLCYFFIGFVLTLSQDTKGYYKRRN